MKNQFFYLILLFHTSFFAQEISSYYSTTVGLGSIIKHKDGIANLVSAHPIVYQISWGKTSDTITTWKKHFNYPDVGFMLTHQKFFNEKLGNVTGFNYFTNHHLLNRNFKQEINLEFGFGLAYTDSPMDYETNNQNNALSTHFLYISTLKLYYCYPDIYKNFGIQTGLSFTHFSNANFKSPNNGINSAFVHFGIQYFPQKVKFDYPKKEKSIKLSQKEKIKLGMDFQLGFHEVYPKLGTKPVYTFRTLASKKIKSLSDLQFGFAFANSLSAKEYAEFRHIAGYSDSDKILDHKQISIFTGYRQYFDKISTDMQFGYYLYDPLHLNKTFYESLSANYSFKNIPFTIGLGLKVHLFKADHAFINFEYQIIK